MEEILRSVDACLSRHGVQPSLDYLLLEWPGWFRCDSSLGMGLAPAKPGIFVLAEEVTPIEDAGWSSKRMLAVFQLSETEDLGIALGGLLLPGNPLRQRLASERCFVRYTVIENGVERSSALKAFRHWVETLSQVPFAFGAGSGLGRTGAESMAEGDAPEILTSPFLHRSASKAESEIEEDSGMVLTERQNPAPGTPQVSVHSVSEDLGQMKTGIHGQECPGLAARQERLWQR